MHKVELAVLGLGPWLVDVLNDKFHVWRSRLWEGCRVEIRADELVGSRREGWYRRGEIQEPSSYIQQVVKKDRDLTCWWKATGASVLLTIGSTTI